VTTTQLDRDIIHALALSDLPDVMWVHDDDLCDCVFQRVGMWKNPYLATTHEIRLCCVWQKLGEQYPDLVRTIPAYRDENTQSWITEPWEWNGEDEMPTAIWYRHLARKEGISVGDARAKYASRLAEKPKGTPRPVVEGEPAVDIVAVMWEALTSLAAEVAELKAR
jgi:hypothetical protein